MTNGSTIALQQHSKPASASGSAPLLSAQLSCMRCGLGNDMHPPHEAVPGRVGPPATEPQALALPAAGGALDTCSVSSRRKLAAAQLSEPLHKACTMAHIAALHTVLHSRRKCRRMRGPAAALVGACVGLLQHCQMYHSLEYRLAICERYDKVHYCSYYEDLQQGAGSDVAYTAYLCYVAQLLHCACTRALLLPCTSCSDTRWCMIQSTVYCLAKKEVSKNCQSTASAQEPPCWWLRTSCCYSQCTCATTHPAASLLALTLPACTRSCCQLLLPRHACDT
jgi:hypothetical protein